MRSKVAHQKVVITLTTTPSRINKIQDTLATIFKQNLKADAVYLNIPYKLARTGEEYQIPEWLAADKRVTILRTKDYGPATKLLGLLEQRTFPPETIIIAVDDDVYYPNNLILQLVYSAQKHPACAVGISGAAPDYDANGKINIDSYMGLVHKYDQSDFVPILQGYGGIAYRAKFFSDDIFEIVDINACQLVDDIYFAFYLQRHNVARYTVKNDYISVYEINWLNDVGCGSDALHLQTPTPAFKHKQCIDALRQRHPHVHL